MTSYELKKAIKEQLRPEHLFIKVWRKEEDFIDFDLLERFLANLRDDQLIDGFELVTTDEMWDYVRRVAGSKVSRDVKEGKDVLLWSDEEALVTKEMPFNPESLITIFDAETDDSYVD